MAHGMRMHAEVGRIYVVGRHMDRELRRKHSTEARFDKCVDQPNLCQHKRWVASN